MNQTGNHDETALIRAARNLDASHVKLLLEAGADVNMDKRSEDTALILSVTYCLGNERNVAEKVCLLLKPGCHINKGCRFGLSAFS